jgi:hypothetical protein
MSRNAEEQARQLSEFVDGLVLQRRGGERDPECDWNDRELRELRSLIASFHDVRLEPPSGFAERLGRQLPALAAQDRQRRRQSLYPTAMLRRAYERLAAMATQDGAIWRSAVCTVIIAVLLVLFRSGSDTSASASEILTRSDAALARLAAPGQLLYRRWRVTTANTTAKGTVTRANRTIHEWMDGRNVDHVAGRFYSDQNELRMAYATAIDAGRLRPHVYFSPGLVGEPQGLLSLEPTIDEFREAIARFPPETQPALSVYVGREHIYEPIIGEVRANRSIIESPMYGVSEVPRLVMTLDRTTLNGVPVYAVRVVDPAWIEFAWRVEGPPTVWLTRREAVRYIARDSYLSLKTEETLDFEDGRRRVTTRELDDMRSMPASDAAMSVFTIELPPGTVTHRQSAYEQLSGVAAAFSRVPDFSRALPQRTHH